jgi:hypothetical protein
MGLESRTGRAENRKAGTDGDHHQGIGLVAAEGEVGSEADQDDGQ